MLRTGILLLQLTFFPLGGVQSCTLQHWSHLFNDWNVRKLNKDSDDLKRLFYVKDETSGQTGARSQAGILVTDRLCSADLSVTSRHIRSPPPQVNFISVVPQLSDDLKMGFFVCVCVRVHV